MDATTLNQVGSKHTPGPWYVWNATGEGGTPLHDTTNHEGKRIVYSKVGVAAVAEVASPWDARLIAAAPAMLAALQEVANMRPPFLADKAEESAARASVIGDMRQVARGVLAKLDGA